MSNPCPTCKRERRTADCMADDDAGWEWIWCKYCGTMQRDGEIDIPTITIRSGELLNVIMQEKEHGEAVRRLEEIIEVYRKEGWCVQEWMLRKLERRKQLERESRK